MVKLIIFNFYESERELRTIESGVFGSKGVESRAVNSKYVSQAEKIL